MAGQVIYKTVTKGLVLYIDAGNPKSYVSGSAIVTDLAGTQNGTLTNGVGYSSSNGGYFTFDGVNDYIDFGINTTIQPITTATYSCWVNLAGYGTPWSFRNDLAGINGIRLWYDSGGVRTILTNLTVDQIRNFTGVTTNTWYYLTLSFNGTTIKVYSNGTLLSSASQTVVATNGFSPFRIGSMNGFTWYMNGNVSQMKIYDVQLSDAEVLQNYNATKNRYI